jgi:hypothetical protein
MQSNAWIPVGNMTRYRAQHTATYIHEDNSIVLAGGDGYGNARNDVEKFIPSCSCLIGFGRGLSASRYGGSAVALASGDILFIGGYGLGYPNLYAEIYNSIKDSVGFRPSMAVPVGYSNSATLLPHHGRVLLSGGSVANSLNATAQGQVFNPASSTIALVNGTMSIGRMYHAASFIDTRGYILITGGAQNHQSPDVRGTDLADLYCETNNSFVALSSKMSRSRARHTSTYIPTIDQVLLCGGYDNTCELFDPSTNTFILLEARMSESRVDHAAVYLPVSNRVLIAGGRSSSADLFDPVSRMFAPAASMMTARNAYTLTLLPSSSDNVLACGGYVDPQWMTMTASCEMYIP